MSDTDRPLIRTDAEAEAQAGVQEEDWARIKAEAQAEARRKDKSSLERGDFFAMIVSGFLVVGLPCLLLILVIVGVSLLLFG